MASRALCATQAVTAAVLDWVRRLRPPCYNAPCRLRPTWLPPAGLCRPLPHARVAGRPHVRRPLPCTWAG